MVAFKNRCGSRIATRTGARLHGAVGFYLLGGLVGFVAGCSGGAVAPVQSLTEPTIPGRERGHVVGTGDTVYSIAWRHGIDYRALARFNSIRDPFTIFPGQRLLIPEPGDVVPPASEPNAVTSGLAAPSDVSTHGIGTQSAPVLKPLPRLPPAPKPSMETPRKVPPKALAPQPVPEPASKPLAESPVAAKVAAGVSWTWPAKGKTIGSFGRGGNKGLDIAGAFEQPIRAAARGQVVYAGSGLIGYGKLVIVKHNSHLLSAYAHNERLYVKEGDEVKGGQHFADMGRSGKGRVMLHFEIRRDGKPVDPLRFLP